MQAKGLVWLGTRTRTFDDTVRFFEAMLGLRMEHEAPDFAFFRLPNGDTVEVFGPGDRDHEHFTTVLPSVSWLTTSGRRGRTSKEPGSRSSVPYTRLAAPGPISQLRTATSTS